MEAIVKEAAYDATESSPDDIAEARHFLSRYRERLRLCEQGLTALLEEKKKLRGGSQGARMQVSNEYVEPDDIRFTVAKQREEAAAAEAKKVRFVEQVDEEFEAEWQAYFNKKSKEEGKKSGIEGYLNSIKGEAYNVWLNGPDPWLDFAKNAAATWLKEQAEKKALSAPESPQTQPIMDESVAALIVGGSPSMRDRRAAIKRRREEEQADTTPPTQKKIRGRHRSIQEVERTIGNKRESVFIGGFKTGEGSPAKKRYRLANGFKRVIDAGNRYDGSMIPGLRRVASAVH